MVIVISILVVPVIIYGFFELNSLTVDERELEKIYERQLTSVLFTINQSVQDKMAEITNKLEWDLETMNDEELLDELRTYQFFNALYLRDIRTNEAQLFTRILDWEKGWQEDGEEEIMMSRADSIYIANQSVVNRLVRYKDAGGFMKLEQGNGQLWYQDKQEDKQTDFIFFVLGKGDNARLGIYFFDAQLMIEQNLGPKMQEIAQEDFILTCRKVDDGSQVYSTSGNITGNIRSEPLDLLPKYEIGIAREGGTVEEAVNRRKTNNLMALGLLMLVMITGIGLVFRNIQREMQLAQNKADFVSNVSHEIRTPLALINMFAETLLLGRVKEESKKKEYYGIITKEVARLTNMINRILSFSKIEANKRVYQKTPLDLNNVARDVLNTYSYHLENNGFDYESKLSGNGLVINADQEAVIEVLVNLLDNAMKYSQDTKLIEIATGEKAGKAYISIKDHGLGIPKNQLNKLFEKFYRVPTGDVHDTKGSGLGLTIVKHIVDAHEGSIEVSSEVGKGSTFKLYFPLENNTNA